MAALVSSPLTSVATLLNELRAAYSANNLPVRIRIEEMLSKVWATNPPPIGVLGETIADSAAPADYRLYFAKVMANKFKMGGYDTNDVARGLIQLRSLVAADKEEPAFRADLANVLTRVDQSAEAVRAVALLLVIEDDRLTAGAVAALCHSTNSEAIMEVLNFSMDENLLKTKPLALMAALGALATTTSDVTPMLNRIIKDTDDFKMFAGAFQCLIHARSSMAVLEAIVQAHSSVPRFPMELARTEQMCRAAAQRHAQFFTMKQDELDPRIAQAFSALLKKEAR
jgi:hypothetical protein